MLDDYGALVAAKRTVKGSANNHEKNNNHRHESALLSRGMTLSLSLLLRSAVKPEEK